MHENTCLSFPELCHIKAQKALHAVYGASYIFYDLQVSMRINQTFIEIINISLLKKLGNSDPIVFQVYGSLPVLLVSYTGESVTQEENWSKWTHHIHTPHTSGVSCIFSLILLIYWLVFNLIF